MHAKLTTTLAAATLVAAVPAVGIANAHDGKGKSNGESSSKRCDRGKGYEAQGLLAAGSTLEQVAGIETARRGDDRYSGTVVVQVRKGSKRGRVDRGLTSFVVTNVRALGTLEGDAPLPPVGTRVQLVGKLAKPCAPAPSPTPEPSPTPDPSPTPEPMANQLRHDDEDATSTTPPAADYPSSTTPAGSGEPAGEAPKASAAVIRLVVFKPSKRRPVVEDDSASGEDRPESKRRPGRGDDACAVAPPVAEMASYDDDSAAEDGAAPACERPSVEAPPVGDPSDDVDDDRDEDRDGERGPRR